MISAHWCADPRVTPSPVEVASGGALLEEKPPFALPMLGDLARLMVFYNTRHTTQPGSRNRKSSDLSELTKVALSDVKLRRVSPLHDLRLRVDASINDPLYLLMKANHGAAEIRSGWGMKVELAFSMGSARTVEAVQRMRAMDALGPIRRDRRETA